MAIIDLFFLLILLLALPAGIFLFFCFLVGFAIDESRKLEKEEPEYESQYFSIRQKVLMLLVFVISTYVSWALMSSFKLPYEGIGVFNVNNIFKNQNLSFFEPLQNFKFYFLILLIPAFLIGVQFTEITESIFLNKKRKFFNLIFTLVLHLITILFYLIIFCLISNFFSWMKTWL